MQKIKYSLDWEHMPKGNKIPAYGNCHIRLAAPAALYLHLGADKILLGYGSEFKVEGPNDHYHLSTSVESVVYSPKTRLRESEGEVFTNAEMKPLDDGFNAIVKQAVRRLELQNRSAMKAQKAEFDKMMQKRPTTEVIDDEEETEETSEADSQATEETTEETTSEAV